MKLFHKIAVTTLGLAMATAVGAGIAHHNRSDMRVARAAYSGTPVSSLVDGDVVYIAYNINSDVYEVTGFHNNNYLSVTKQDSGFYGTYPITVSKVDSNYYFKTSDNKYIAYTSSATSGSNNLWQVASTDVDGAAWTVSFNGTEPTVTNVFNNVRNMRGNSNSGQARVSGYVNNGQKPIAFYKLSAAEDPTVTSVVASAGSLTGKYKGFASIQCSAQVNGEHNPSQTVTWTLSANSTYVASQTAVDGASINSDGKITFTKDVSVYAFATSTVSGYTDKRGSVQCTASGLVDTVEYIQLDKTGRIKEGMKVAILNNTGDCSLSTTQNSNNRAGVLATASGNLSYIQEDYTQIFTLVAGTQSGSYAFSYDDSGTTKYIFAASSSGNQLKTTTELTDAASFTISITDGKADIIACDSGVRGYLRYNANSGNPIFSCYQDTCNASLYIKGHELPADVALSSISNIQLPSVQEGSTVNLTASYLPINATEGIDVIVTDDDGEVQVGEAQMSNGVISFTVKGITAGEVEITIKGKETASATSSIVFSVAAYNATHTKITSASTLYNGLRVIMGNAENKLASGLHAGGNNVPAVEIAFAEDGSTLSNAAGTAVEYTLWQFTIDEVTGWAFYDNGYFLTALTGTNNYLKRTLTLSSLCLFNITYSGEDVSIVCAASGVERNTMFCNKGSKLFSCYAASTTTQQHFDLYANNQGQTDAKVIAGFEDVLLKMDAISAGDEGTDLCKTNGYYSNAKYVYNNVLTSGQKALMSAEATARLEAWATANEEQIVNYEIVPTNTISLFSNNNNATMIIIIATSVAAISIVGAYFIIRKRKEQR